MVPLDLKAKEANRGLRVSLDRMVLMAHRVNKDRLVRQALSVLRVRLVKTAQTDKMGLQEPLAPLAPQEKMVRTARTELLVSKAP